MQIVQYPCQILKVKYPKSTNKIRAIISHVKFDSIHEIIRTKLCYLLFRGFVLGCIALFDALEVVVETA